MARFWLVLILTAALACEASNPILGNWTVDPDRSPPGSAVGLKISGATDLEFLESRMVAGSSSLDVTYIIEKGRIRYQVAMAALAEDEEVRNTYLTV